MTIDPGRIARGLWLVVAGLTLASVGGQAAKYLFGCDYGMGLIEAFDLNTEHNIPTWYASATLLLSAILLGLIAADALRARRPYAAHWSGLSILFVLMSIDEAMVIHEQWSHPLRLLFGQSGALYYTWVVLGGAGILPVSLIYWRFVLALPQPTQRQVLLAAVLYVGGAMGLEMVGGYYAWRTGTEQSFAYALITTGEELLELSGVVVFIHALLCHLGRQTSVIRIGNGDYP